MGKLAGIDGVYIIHALKGYEYAAERIQHIFSSLGIEYELVTDGDPSLFTDKLLAGYFCPEIRSVLTDGVLSCTLNHIFSYEKMLAANNQFALIFENDPFFPGDFKEKLKKVVEEAKELPPGFIVSLENTTLKFPAARKIRKGRYLYEAQSGRCAGAYLIDREAAFRILEDLKVNKCCQVIDWWHNSMIDRKIVRMYWAHPPFVEQGSHNGKMCSTISSKNKSYSRQISWEVQKFYKTYISRWF